MRNRYLCIFLVLLVSVSQVIGQENFYLCGVYLNTARIIISVPFSIQMIVLLNAQAVLKLFGQPRGVSVLSQMYCLYLPPGTFMYV